MTNHWRTLASACAAVGLLLGACGDDDVEDATETAEEVAGDAAETAGDAWASFRTQFERLVDKASTGDSEAQEELLDRCRDSLQELRKDNDPKAERVGALCDKIRDADDGTAWDELRNEVKDIDSGS